MTDHTISPENADRLQAVADMGLTMKAAFVPFSKSRNAGNAMPSLNWRVTILHKGRAVLTTDYSAGCGHCPAKADRAPATYRAPNRKRACGTPYPGTTSAYRAPTPAEALSDYLAAWRRAECESGVAMEYNPFRGDADFVPRRVRPKGATISATLPILPDLLDVLCSLSMDAGALDYATFEDWAAEYGYSADSREAESVYRTCLDLALKMRAALGETNMAALRDLFQDY